MPGTPTPTLANASLGHVSDTLLFWAVVAYSLAMLAFAGYLALRANPVWRDRAGRAGVALTATGWLVHLAAATTRGVAAHRVPWGNMYEFSTMVTLIAVTLFLALLVQPVRRVQHRPAPDLRWLGAFVMAPVVLYLGLAGTVLYAKAGPLVPALNSYWIVIHVFAGITATGAFMVSGVVSLLYLLKDRQERRDADALVGLSLGPGTATAAELDIAVAEQRGGIVRSLPSAATLDRLAHRIITFAFPVWTFAIIAGAIWAEKAWSKYWSWDPKETWSFITWLAYAAYLHARATAGWRGRKAAVVSLVGFGCLMVDYYVVNTVITGLHSYSGV